MELKKLFSFNEFEKKNEREDYRDERGEVPGEHDTGPHEYVEEDKEGIVDNKEDFKEYVYNVYKEAFKEDFDEEIADDIIEDISQRVENGEIEWSNAVGIIQQSLAE